jgi:hypothetical protein
MNSMASRAIKAKDANGTEFDMTLELGIPYQKNLNQWGCAVRVTNLFEPPREIYGMDSWQAVQLAFQFISRMLEDFVARGGRLYWKETMEPLSVQGLFSSTTP